MPDTCELLAKLGIKMWKLSGMVLSEAWKPYTAEHTASKEELNRGCIKLPDRFQQLGRPFSMQIDHRYIYSHLRGKASVPALARGSSEESLKQPICSCMKSHPYLLPDGTLMPCMPLSNCGLDKGMPNLRMIPLVEVLHSKSRFFDFVSITPEEMFRREDSECATCEYRFQCYCGCRVGRGLTSTAVSTDPI